MAPLKKIYLEELARIQDRIHDLFEQALLASEYDERDGGLPGTWAPSVDVLETEDSFLVLAELPGVGRDDIQLQVKDRRLELSGRRPSLGENRNFLRMERSYGPFRRTFELSAPIDSEGITAAFDQGVLKILLPKRTAGVAAVPVRPASQEES
jgi:HSP20 family protein